MEPYTFSTHICTNEKEMEATREGIAALYEGLGRNIMKQTGMTTLGRSVRIFLKEGGRRVVGGIVGEIFGGWVYVSLLWVEESLRRRGYGTRLVSLMEGEAKGLGCHHAHLDTYSFEARPFYEKLGYEVFGMLEDYPEGHRKYFLKKDLV